MSYCSFGNDSDVYVFQDATLLIFRCCGCKFHPHETGLLINDHVCLDRQEMIDHLLEHRKAGHKVPEYALERLKEEANKLDEVST